MPQFFIAFLASALATLGGREAIRVSRLAAAMGRGGALAPAIVLSSIASSILAAWVGLRAGLWLSPAARQILVAVIVLIAAAEVGLLRAGPGPREPTRSFAAILLVLLSALAADAARLLIVAVALAWGDLWVTAGGGVLGSGAALLLARVAGAEWEDRAPIQWLRNGVTAALVLASMMIGLTALS